MDAGPIQYPLGRVSTDFPDIPDYLRMSTYVILPEAFSKSGQGVLLKVSGTYHRLCTYMPTCLSVSARVSLMHAGDD